MSKVDDKREGWKKEGREGGRDKRNSRTYLALDVRASEEELFEAAYVACFHHALHRVLAQLQAWGRKREGGEDENR